ncbi:unnamed protein product [marine sediment metagenome]|uniref:Fibronectin type-III domain-containing protein n=1 Tax=marine sediment metagenome TaxID=412755 RepID=X0VQG5_9ZZZZ
MKAIILTFLLILWAGCEPSGCELPADNDPKNIAVVWDSNPEPDMSHYRFYFWQSSDSNTWALSNLTYLYDIPHSFTVDSIMTDSLSITLDYFAAGATAVDSAGNESDMGYSKIWQYYKTFGPSPPESLRLVN